MTSPRPTAGRALLLAVLLASVLAGCGRKGPLEAPPNATNAIALPDSATGAEEVGIPAGTSPFGKAQKTDRAFKIPDRDFVLDPLL